MARIEITYTTKQTNFREIDEEIENIFAQHGGTQDGGGHGPEGREIVFNVFPDSELKRILNAFSKVGPMMKSRGVVETLKWKRLDA